MDNPLMTDHYSLTINNEPYPVHQATVHRGGAAYFAYASARSLPLIVELDPKQGVKEAVIRPLHKKITPEIQQHKIRFVLKEPGQYSVEFNGRSLHPLFLFVNLDYSEHTDNQKTHIYGPGNHTISTKELNSGESVYFHREAYVKVVLDEMTETPIDENDWAGMKRYKPAIHAKGKTDITISGTGILDLSGLPWHARSPLSFSHCRNLLIEGITILDSPEWNIIIDNCKDVEIRGVKIISHRENSDGIDLVNSTNVHVHNCFLRCGDDGVAVKTFAKGSPAEDILVEECVIWNDRVRALGITCECAKPVRRVTFRDCDIIHDLTNSFYQGWTLAVWINDPGPVEEILFENIRCEDTRTKLIEVGMEADIWSQTGTLGNIRNIIFKDIYHLGDNTPKVQLIGGDKEHLVENITFDNVIIHGQSLTGKESFITINEFTKDIVFRDKA